MKKFNASLWSFLFCAAAVGVCSGPSTAFAVTYVYDPFNYSDGSNLGGQSPSSGLTWGQANTGASGIVDMTVTSGSLTAPTIMPDSQGNMVTYGAGTTSDRINLGGTHNSGSSYYSFLLNVSDLGTLPDATRRQKPDPSRH